jgi:hypothetical protein
MIAEKGSDLIKADWNKELKSLPTEDIAWTIFNHSILVWHIVNIYFIILCFKMRFLKNSVSS